MKLGPPAAGILIAIAITGCGISTSSPDTTKGSGVAPPTQGQESSSGGGESNFSEEQAQHYYEELIEVGTKPSVANCYVRQMEMLTPAEQELLLSEGEETNQEVIALNQRFSDACLGNSPSSVKNVTPEQLEALRENFKESIVPLLEEQGANSAQIDCVHEEIDALSDEELETLTGTGPEAKRVAAGVFEGCVSAG